MRLGLPISVSLLSGHSTFGQIYVEPANPYVPTYSSAALYAYCT
jgi:hypothetical protein